jgi:shikimate kinase
VTQRPLLSQVVLVGFMGSGKTAVGERLAELLGWQFVDSDVEVEGRLNLRVREVFAQLGEPVFRETERAVVSEALRLPNIVVSTGGGWAAQEGTMESVPTDALVVWLQVSAEEALRRIRSGTARPLLDRPDALAFATTLLRRRGKRYALANRQYDTASANPQEIAEQIRLVVRSSEGVEEDHVSDGVKTPDQDE